MPATSPQAVARAKEARRRRIAQHLIDIARILDLYKTSRGCTDCGYREHPAALHFDHTDPATKLESLGWRENRSKLRTRAKFERYFLHVQRYCEVRCANCHAVRTTQEKHWLRQDAKQDVEEDTLF